MFLAVPSELTSANSSDIELRRREEGSQVVGRVSICILASSKVLVLPFSGRRQIAQRRYLQWDLLDNL